MATSGPRNNHTEWGRHELKLLFTEETVFTADTITTARQTIRVR